MHVRYCDYCGKGGRLYLCDFCDVAVHSRCLTKEGLIIPTRSADWASPQDLHDVEAARDEDLLAQPLRRLSR